MLRIFREALDAGTDAIESGFEFVERRLRRLGVQLALLVALALVGGGAVCGLLAGVVVLLTPALGLAAALLIVSGAATVLVAVTFLLVHRAARVHVHDDDHDENARADDRRTAVPPAAATSETRDAAPTDTAPPARDPIEDAVTAAVAHPEVVASAAFAAVSVLGLRRSIRLLRAASAVASAGSVASQVATSMHHHNGHLNGHAASTTANSPSSRLEPDAPAG